MKILFISHEASLSGAPLVLLNFLKWLQNKNKFEISVLLLKDGVRQSEFKAVCDQLWIKPQNFKKHDKLFFLKKALLSKIGFKIYSEEEQFWNQIINWKPDKIYCNTILSLPKGIALKAKLNHANLILHVHELPTIIDILMPNFDKIAMDVDDFIAVSELVYKSLNERYLVSKNKLSLVYEFVYPNINVKPSNVGEDTFVIGASGFIDWRKGYDVFLLVAASFYKKNPNYKVKFKWIGKVNNDLEIIINEDIRKLGLNGKVEFVGESKKAIEDFQEFKLFLMCSREDPFPLVCIEVAQLGIPIICYENATGTQEMLKNGGGKVISYLDIEASVEAITNYINDSNMRELDSRILIEESQKYFVENNAPKILDIIEHQFKN